ncbi:MAG: peptidylprolyl isomerase [Bdellovibrio sp.]|nr:MAG: peptidylprolyl isomerase [Bdellovibrio sp.]
METIRPQKVIDFSYTLKNSQGQVIDSSDEGPMSFLTGSGQIIARLEEELSGMLIGQKKTVSLSASEAYGVIDPAMIINVAKSDLAHLKDLEVGTFLQLDLGEDMKVLRVTAVTDASVTLDGNHPLAGQDLVFDVELVNSRPASAEEISHGHAHGPGGHHHH